LQPCDRGSPAQLAGPARGCAAIVGGGARRPRSLAHGASTAAAGRLHRGPGPRPCGDRSGDPATASAALSSAGLAQATGVSGELEVVAQQLDEVGEALALTGGDA